MVFLDLPLEILPEIFSHIVKPQHLAYLCLVNNSFRTFAVSKLYERVSIYSWHKEGKSKVYIPQKLLFLINPSHHPHFSQVIKLFGTLSRCPHLALLVFRLGKPLPMLSGFKALIPLSEIRDFPKALPDIDDYTLRHVLNGLKNCANLRSCTWTRDGSLNSSIIKALLQCKNLRDLELNGHNIGNYDPQLLLGFTELYRISLIMPSVPVVSQLKPWLLATGATLRSLTLLCKVRSTPTSGFQGLGEFSYNHSRRQAFSPMGFLKQ